MLHSESTRHKFCYRNEYVLNFTKFSFDFSQNCFILNILNIQLYNTATHLVWSRQITNDTFFTTLGILNLDQTSAVQDSSTNLEFLIATDDRQYALQPTCAFTQLSNIYCDQISCTPATDTTSRFGQLFSLQNEIPNTRLSTREAITRIQLFFFYEQR